MLSSNTPDALLSESYGAAAKVSQSVTGGPTVAPFVAPASAFFLPPPLLVAADYQSVAA